MPRSRPFILDAMESLAQQLAFISKETAVRQLERVRALHESIHRDNLYGWSDVEYTITQFRSEKRSKESELRVVGASLARDLNELALRMSARAPHLASEAWTLPALAKSWNVSERTLHRWRAFGLLCCWAHRPSSRAGAHALILGVRKVDAAAFRSANASRTARAGAFSTINDATRQQILARASQEAAAGERRISEAARKIATDLGRSRESVRALLKANPEASRGMLAGRTKRSTRAASLALAASRRGLSATEVARRLNCSRASADRMIQRERGSYLRSIAGLFLTRESEIPVTFARADAGEVLLAPAGVHSGLLSAEPINDPQRWLSMKPSALSPADAVRIDAARMMAVRYLLFRAKSQALALPLTRPTELALDRIESDLRWVRLILRTLFVSVIPTVVTRLKVWSGIDPLQFVDEDAARTLELAARVLVEVVLESDPVKIAEHRVKLSRALALAFDRRLVSLAIPTRVSIGSEQNNRLMHEPLDVVLPWHHATEVLTRRVAMLSSSPQRTLWHRRLGWDGSAPATLAQLAAAERKPNAVIARTLNAAIAQQRKKV